MEIEPLLLDITETIVPLPLLPGSIYEIFLIATDNVGNTQQDADNIFVIDFPKIAVTCPSNCSGRGICTELGTCKCDMGYYGNDCGEGQYLVRMSLHTYNTACPLLYIILKYCKICSLN